MVLVVDGVLLYAIIRAAAGGFWPVRHSAIAVSGVLMLGLAAYLVIRVPREGAARDLAAVLLLTFPLVVLTASAPPQLAFYHGRLGGFFVGLADAGGPTMEGALDFLMTYGYMYLAALAPLPLLHLAMGFPRPLTAVDIPMPRREAGLAARAVRPLRTGMAWLKRALLHRPLLLIVGVVPAAFVSLDLMVPAAVADVLLVVLALSYLRDGYAVSAPAERRRVLWVLGGLFVFGIAVSAFILGAGPGVLSSWTPRVVREALRWLVWLAAPVAFGLIAAGVLYRGAFDPSLVIRRTTVYGALGVLLTMLFAVVEEVTAERMFEQAGLPDSMGAGLAALVVAAVFGPLRGKLESLYDAFLSPSTRDIEEAEAASLLVARLGDADSATGVEGLSATVLLHRCARRVAADEGGSVRAVEDRLVALVFPDPARAVDGCVALRSRLTMTGEILGAKQLRPRFAVYRPEPGEGTTPEESLETALRLAAAAEPGEVVLSAGVAAEPGVIRGHRLEATGSASGAGDAFRVVDEEAAAPVVGSAMKAAAPVLAGVAVVVAVPLLVLAGQPAPPAIEPERGLALSEPGDSLFEAGRDLSWEEARALEARVAAEPDDLTARGLLLRYGCSRRWMSVGQWRSFRHGRWILENRPDHPVAVTAVGCLPWRGGPAYEKARRIVLDHVDGPDPTPRELGIAGYMLVRFGEETERAGRLLERATDADPGDWRLWRHRGWYLEYTVDQYDSAAVAYAKAARLRPRRQRGRMLQYTLRAAQEGGLLDQYRSQVAELGRIARDFAGDTSVAAGKLHSTAESAFGLLTLEGKDTGEAVEHLRASTEPPPGADPPSRAELALAAALWDRGVRAPVVEYLDWAVGLAEEGWWKDRMIRYLRRAREGKDPGFRSYEKTLSARD